MKIHLADRFWRPRCLRGVPKKGGLVTTVKQTTCKLCIHSYNNPKKTWKRVPVVL
jgi:hypothetical protein